MATKTVRIPESLDAYAAAPDHNKAVELITLAAEKRYGHFGGFRVVVNSVTKIGPVTVG